MKITNKLIPIISLAILPQIAFAESIKLHDLGNIYVSKFMDEFSGDISSCQLHITDWRDRSARLSIASTPGAESLRLFGSVGSFEGSGFQFKIDDGQIYKYGQDYPGGEEVYPIVGYDILDELSSGHEIIVRVHPANQYVNSETNRYSLSGSAKAVESLRDCLKVN